MTKVDWLLSNVSPKKRYELYLIFKLSVFKLGTRQAYFHSIILPNNVGKRGAMEERSEQKFEEEKIGQTKTLFEISGTFVHGQNLQK